MKRIVKIQDNGATADIIRTSEGHQYMRPRNLILHLDRWPAGSSFGSHGEDEYEE